MAANLIPIQTVITPSRREKLWIKEGKKCHWCGQPTRLGSYKPDGTLAWNSATTDHVLPRWRGGSDDESNLVSACHLCNNRRSHEDACGIPDGSMLGKYDPDKGMVYKGKKGPMVRVALTGDEKKAIMNGKSVAPMVSVVTLQDLEEVKKQRDHAFKEVAQAKFTCESHRLALEEVKAELQVWKSMTVWMLIRLRIAEWIVPKIK